MHLTSRPFFMCKYRVNEFDFSPFAGMFCNMSCWFVYFMFNIWLTVMEKSFSLAKAFSLLLKSELMVSRKKGDLFC